jgi:hypothetical protein
MGATFKDLAGQKFGRIQIFSFAGFKKRKYKNEAAWNGLCACGIKVVVFAGDLLIGGTKSCGCLQREKATRLLLKHGFYTKNSSKTQKRFYRIWKCMKSRCLTLKNGAYPNYGGRGIKVCARWLESFENFRDDMYASYLKHVEEFGEKDTTIDRIDVNGNYELSNVRWATNEIQNLNKRFSISSKNISLHKKLRIYLDSVIRRFALGLAHSSMYEKYIGCTSIELHNYLESKFTKEMSWHNYGRYSKNMKRWQIDHIIPVNMFDLSVEKDRYTCYNYKNLQPKWVDEHMKKSRNKENYNYELA